jgi:type I restriction enzyme S subunit
MHKAWSDVTLRGIAVQDGLQTGPFGGQLHAEEYVSDGIPVVMPQDILQGQISDDHIARITTPKAESLSRHRLRVGDLVFARRGDIGRVGITEPTHAGWLCGTGCLRARLGDSVLPKFAHLAVQSAPSIAWLNVHAVGQTMANLNTTILGRLPIRLPSLDEQHRIAEVLDTVDDVIQKTEQLIAKLKQMKQGLLHDLLTRGVDDNGELRDPERHPEQFKDSPLGRIPKAWDVLRLGDVSSFVTSGSRGWAAYYADDGALFIRIGNLTRAHINLRLDDLVFVRPPTGGEGERTQLEAGDLLVSITADLGIIGVVPDDVGEAYVNQHIALVRVDPAKSNSRWLGHFLAGPGGRLQISRLNDTGAKAGLNLPTVKSLFVAAPSLHEQMILAERLDVIDSRIAAEERAIVKVAAIKRGLMEDLLTGRVRTTVLEVAA